MFFPILVTGVTVLIVYFVLQKTLFPLIQISRMKKRLSAEGVDANAVLLNMQETGLYVNNQPQIRMQLQVHPAFGRSFVSEACEVLNFVDLSQLAIGGNLKVRYNPDNVKEVMIVR